MAIFLSGGARCAAPRGLAQNLPPHPLHSTTSKAAATTATTITTATPPTTTNRNKGEEAHLHLVYDIVRHARLRQQNVELSGHPAGDRVHRKLNLPRHEAETEQPTTRHGAERRQPAHQVGAEGHHTTGKKDGTPAQLVARPFRPKKRSSDQKSSTRWLSSPPAATPLAVQRTRAFAKTHIPGTTHTK